MNDIEIMNDAEIIELARLRLAVDRSPDNQELLQTFGDRLARLDQEDRIGTLCMHLAAELLDRQSFGLSTDNAETERRCCSIAAALGATVSGTKGCLVFDPATLH